MTPAELKAYRDTLPGDTAEAKTLKLANILHCSTRSAWRKLTDDGTITPGDVALVDEEKRASKLKPQRKEP